MMPVFQTRYGYGQGNCLLACVASILHRPLSDIPDFATSGCGWFGELYEWCLNEGIGLMCCDPKDFEHSIFVNTHGIGIFEMAHFKEENHAVIVHCVREEAGCPDSKDESEWKWRADVVHDPNPTHPERGNLVHLLFLLPSVEVTR